MPSSPRTLQCCLSPGLSPLGFRPEHRKVKLTTEFRLHLPFSLLSFALLIRSSRQVYSLLSREKISMMTPYMLRYSRRSRTFISPPLAEALSHTSSSHHMSQKMIVPCPHVLEKPNVNPPPTLEAHWTMVIPLPAVFPPPCRTRSVCFSMSAEGVSSLLRTYLEAVWSNFCYRRKGTRIQFWMLFANPALKPTSARMCLQCRRDIIRRR